MIFSLMKQNIMNYNMYINYLSKSHFWAKLFNGYLIVKVNIKNL
jgi:hypothetical protein